MKINFIPDEVLKLTDDTDLLGTKPYSETIFEIINNCEGNKNIGLFGSWGSGKSTILRTLENLIDNHNTDKENKIAYFEFDAWKYSKDDFRRSFLIELTQKFNIKSKAKLEKLLYSESSFEDPKQIIYKFNWLSIPNWLLLFLVAFAFWFYFQSIIDVNKDIKAVVALLSMTISLLSTATSNTINKYKVVVKENKIVEPERFEAIFDEVITEITIKSTVQNKIYNWIQKILGKTRYSKVIIVIDNLDRCDDENLLVTLNTIKNFLEHKKVIFILPVDEKGISSFLSQKTDDADEYLRKIFHLIIRLKSFSQKELTEFTNNINETYGLALNFSSVRIICQEFTNNPRKIIQFLNNYQSEMRLIDEQSKKGYIDGDYIKNNLSFFIKLLIIKYEWKSLYDEILHDKTLLNKVNDVITNLKPDKKNLYSINKTNVKLTDSQRNFLFSTQEIHCANIDPFVLNIDLDKDIPDDIKNFIRNAKYNEVLNYLDNNEIALDEAKLLRKMDELYSNLTYKHRDYSFIALPILKLLIEFVLDEKQQNFRKHLIENHKEYTFLKSLFKDKKIVELFDKFDFERLTKATKWFSDNISDDLFNSFTNHLKGTLFDSSTTIKEEKKKISTYLKTFKEGDKLNSISKEFSKKLNSKPELSTVDILSQYDIASKVITRSTYRLLAKKLSDDELKDKYRISIICYAYLSNNPNEVQTREYLINYYLEDLEEFYKNESITVEVYEDYIEYFERLNKVSNVNVNIELSASQIELINNLNAHFFARYRQGFEENDLFDIYEAFFELMKNLIFYFKKFNLVSYRTNFFGRYLKKDFSTKLSLKINNILFQDVKKFGAYAYPFSETLIEHYEDTEKANLPYGETLLIMLEKTDNDEGLEKSEIEQIILRTINVFSISPNKDSIALMAKLKKAVGKQLLETLNNDKGVYTSHYIQNVKLLKDNWFYGNSVLNYLNHPLIVLDEGSYPTFRGRLGVVSKTFTTNEQIEFIEDLIDKASAKVYKWLRLSFSIIPKKVYDVYLKNLILAHENGIVGNNDFFEWVVKIPKEYFYRKRLGQYIKYLTELNISHRTYKPKKANALNHLSKS